MGFGRNPGETYVYKQLCGDETDFFTELYPTRYQRKHERLSVPGVHSHVELVLLTETQLTVVVGSEHVQDVPRVGVLLAEHQRVCVPKCDLLNVL